MIFSGKLDPSTIAYFSMEIGLDPELPTYSGGLGVLAGDSLFSAADLGVPMVGLTLAYRKGYIRQHLDDQGNQTESEEAWEPESRLEAVPHEVSVRIEGRDVKVRAYVYPVRGRNGHEVPVYLLDTAMPANDPWDQAITDRLYGGEERYRLAQEIVLGIGGVLLLRKLGHDGNLHLHMNEGHSALLTLALIEESLDGNPAPVNLDPLVESTREKCVFTTHTPVPAGHDRFPEGLVLDMLGEDRTEILRRIGALEDGELNMTQLGMFCSRYINGVAMRHGQVSREMFPEHPINTVTNGVHAVRWTAPPMAELFDQELPEWRADNAYLRYALGLPLDRILETHLVVKRKLFEIVKEKTGVDLDENTFTIGFARRSAGYKRAPMLLSDRKRVCAIAKKVGRFQVVYGGKAHPRDEPGKAIIRDVFDAARELEDCVKIVYLENYEMSLAVWMCAGVDLWLNNPIKPNEASGTSGMKAAVNGVPSLSTLDGWWIEGHIENGTGWSIGSEAQAPSDNAAELASMYDKLEHTILPLYYNNRLGYAEVMRNAIAINASFFNTQRMVTQYMRNAYFSRANDRPNEGSE